MSTRGELSYSVCKRDRDNRRWRRVIPKDVDYLKDLMSIPSIHEQLPTRDFEHTPLAVGEVLCERSACLHRLFLKHRMRDERATNRKRAKPYNDLWSYPNPVALWKRNRFDRYCTPREAVEVLLDRVDIKGVVLDMCGSAGDFVSLVMEQRGRVVTNDINTR